MAAEFATSAATNAVGNLATEYASPYVNYFFRFGRIVEEFKNQRKELELKKGRLNIDVDEAVRQTEVIYEDVEDWLTRAEGELREAQSLEDEIERNKCFNWCPSWGWRYCLSKKVARKTLCIRKLIDTCKFERLGHRLPLQGIEFLISKDFKASQSSSVAFNAIVEALTTEGVDMVGLNGMPGVGKTTLAKEVGKYAGEQKLFDKVVMVTMSQTPNISNIQDRIAEMLSLEFKAKTEKGKAEELVRRLKVEKILIIIDDVWKEFELETIGIPYDGENNGCKILLTTRLQSVCFRMNCQEKFELGILTEDEAWDLFKYYAGLEALSRTTTKLIEVAKDLARECKGLPLAIKAVAGALKGKNLIAWETSYRKLKDSRHPDNEGVTRDIYSILSLSYDFLTEVDPKSCFLLCSLFPEDYNIPIDRLALIAIGQGLFCRTKLMEEQRDEIRLVLEELQKSGLLLEIDDKENTVRMHDVVRDFAHWLTSKGDAKFMVRIGLTKWPMNETFESHTAIALWDFNMNSFPDKIEFKNLKTLILHGEEDDWLAIPDTFFKEMKELRVLCLVNVEFSLEVLRFLTNLRALLLFDCKLINESISSLINTEKLEIFSVNDNEIDELSEELRRLRHLKYLYFGMDIKFPSKLLSRLTSLQELHILGENNINLWELSSLSCLSALSLRISLDDDDQCFEEGFVFPKTKSYSIAVNDEPTDMKGQRLGILKISDFSSSLSPFKKFLCDVKKLILWDVHGDKYIVSNEEAGELTELTSLELVHCKDQEYLIEPAQNHANASTSLQSLKDVQVEECRKLKSIFPPCVAHTLFNLQQLSLKSCGELEQVFVFAENDVQIIEQHQNLHHQLHGNAITSLQSLKDVEIECCRKLKSIFSHCVQNLLHLQQLSISDCNDLEQVFCFAENHAQIVEEDEENQLRVLSNLTNLELKFLPKLRCVWSGPTYRVNLSSLNTVDIYRCDKLEFLFSSSLARTLMHLEHVSIEYCESLEHFISTEVENEDACCLPKFNTLKIDCCESLKDVFSITLAQGGLPVFEKIEIIDCPQLMGLFSVPKESDELTPHLQFLKSQNFTNFSLEDYFEILPSLTEFEIKNINYRLHYFAEKHKAVWLDQFDLRDDKLYKFERFICNAQHVKLQRVIYDKNLVPNLNKLTSLIIEGGKGLECLVDAMIVHDQALVLSNLRELELSSLPELKCLWKGPTHNDSLSSLKVVKISKCDGLKYVFPSSLAQSLVQLQQLHICDCDQLKQIISESESDIEIGSHNGYDLCPFLPHLQDLKLDNLMNLKCLWKGPNHKDSLQSLAVVNITTCNRLKHVFPSSLAQSLVQLQQLHIFDCDQLKHIISKSESDIEIGSHNGHDLCLFLLNLQDLHLNNLMNLSGFSSQNRPITLPFLNKLAVESCPRLVNFIILKENEQVGLKELKFSKSGYDISPPKKDSKNVDYATILEIFEIEDTKLLSKVEFIKLDQVHKLRSPIQVARLQYLRRLEVWECNGLKSLFSPMLARNLPQLTLLEIKKCEVLEEIIDTTPASSSSSAQAEAEAEAEARLPHISFPNLKSIRILWCKNLKSLFPVSVIPSLSKLNDIYIKGACKLEQVFKYEAEDDINQDDQNHKRKIVLPPSLRWFQLIRVSGLRSLAPMGYHFLFPSSCYLLIKGYSNSNFLTSFSRDSERVVHAITQAQSPKQLHNDVEGDDDAKITCIASWNLPPYKEEEETEVVDDI